MLSLLLDFLCAPQLFCESSAILTISLSKPLKRGGHREGPQRTPRWHLDIRDFSGATGSQCYDSVRKPSYVNRDTEPFYRSFS
jgi:hypothetical protein